jgi:hypothetical protein
MALADFILDQVRRSRTSDIADQLNSGQVSPSDALMKYAQATGDPTALQAAMQQKKLQGINIDPSNPAGAMGDLVKNGMVTPTDAMKMYADNPFTFGAFNAGNGAPTSALPQGTSPLAQAAGVLQPNQAPAAPTGQDKYNAEMQDTHKDWNFDYLNKNVPPAYRNLVTGMLQGQEVPVNLRNDPKFGAALKIWASNVDPNFSDATYEARKKTLDNFSSGGAESKSAIAGQTALSHLGNFVKNVNAQGNTSFQPTNAMWNAIFAANGDPNVLRAKADMGTLASELATFYKGGTPTDAGTKEMLDMLSTNQGKVGTDAMANEVGTLMKGKIKSMRDQYDTAMGAGASNKRNIFSKEALDTLDKLGVDTTDIIQPNHPAKDTKEAPPASNAPAVTKVINGVTYTQKDGKWYQ